MSVGQSDWDHNAMKWKEELPLIMTYQMTINNIIIEWLSKYRTKNSIKPHRFHLIPQTFFNWENWFSSLCVFINDFKNFSELPYQSMQNLRSVTVQHFYMSPWIFFKINKKITKSIMKRDLHKPSGRIFAYLGKNPSSELSTCPWSVDNYLGN